MTDLPMNHYYGDAGEYGDAVAIFAGAGGTGVYKVRPKERNTAKSWVTNPNLLNHFSTT